MSHAPERKEKDCLNCGTTVHGHFCHVCGQENVVPKESFWKLVIHFFYDITHFDSKFFDSLRYLILQPGFLSKEYIKGRRASYLNPIRMYVFTSAVFFLVFFAVNNPKDAVKITGNEPFSHMERDSAVLSIKKKLEKDPGNSNLKTQMLLFSDTTKVLRPSDLFPYKEDFIMIGTVGRRYKSIREYDSVQEVLPVGEKDGWLKHLAVRKVIQLNEKYKNDPAASAVKMSELILHKLPYLLFVSLPFFALILKLLYIRRKEFYYADHGIFTVHHYIFSFILLLFVFLLTELHDMTGWWIMNFIRVIVFTGWPVYLYMAMKRFYAQGAVKTFFKFIILNILGIITLALLFAFFFLFSIFQL